MSPRDRSWLRPAFSPAGPVEASTAWPDLDPQRCAARFGRRAVEFSRAEYAVLELLVAHPHVLITREELSVHGWHEPLRSTDRVTSAVKRIRQRLARAGVDALEPAAGLVPVVGPGLRVSMSDAPRDSDGNYPAGVDPDDLVIHQQDVQAAVNALWAGGAEAMMIMDQRVLTTSAVRCIGNTLLLQGRTYSPPFVITAIGDEASAGNVRQVRHRSSAKPLPSVTRTLVGWRRVAGGSMASTSTSTVVVQSEPTRYRPGRTGPNS